MPCDEKDDGRGMRFAIATGGFHGEGERSGRGIMPYEIDRMHVCRHVCPADIMLALLVASVLLWPKFREQPHPVI
jgi:hypothetical protein